jgi:hypothetical protein
MVVIESIFILESIEFLGTGLADPAPVAQTFFVDDEVSSKYVLDAIVTLASLNFEILIS